MPAIARQAPNTPSKTREGTWQLDYVVSGTTDEIEAIAAAYQQNPPALLNNQPRKPGEGLSWDNRGIAKVTFEFGPFDDKDEDPQGNNPTLATLQVKGAGATFHTSQCLSQIGYPEGPKVQGIVDAKVVGLHRDGVNGVEIKVPATQYTLTCKWLPAAISGSYFDGLDDLQGRTNESKYTIVWGLRGTKYQIECDIGELFFDDYEAKTSVTRAGVDVWEFSYSLIRIKNRVNIDLGKSTDGTPIIVNTK